MNQHPGQRAAAEPFFLKAAPGERFCIFHAPNRQKTCHSAVIYIHPFGEEMNKTRRMTALQARALADMGCAVLQMDFFGCGDSSGESGDATWEIWNDDLAIAKKWLEQRVDAPISLWGLRLGALLALDFSRNSVDAIDKIVLCQPVLNGESFLTQFLRLRLASEMLGAGKNTGTATLRQALYAGEVLEIAGYDIAPALAASLDAIDATDIIVSNSDIHWIEIVPDADRAMPPARARVASNWRQQGVQLQQHLVTGAPFWATQEITVCPALPPLMSSIFAHVHP